MDRKESNRTGFNWGKYLTAQKSDAAPVHLFDHAQMSSSWSEIEDGVKVEVLNPDCALASKVYWIAEIMKIAGYKALLRFEGYGDDSQSDFWCNLCVDDVHAVGWCATVGKPLVPPKSIQYKYSNWKNFLIQRLTGSKTLPNDFNERVTQSLNCAFKPKMRVEVMDKTQISRKRIGIVENIVGGRLRLQYEDSSDPNDDFWCHCSSYLVHPIGWSEKVGHRILVANKEYKVVPGFKNSKPDMFTPVKNVKLCGFKVGMKLEAIDPLNLSSICVATVRKVLKNGYLMIGIDGSEAIGGTDWFCYHCTSPSIFPVGYCSSNNITLSIPSDYKKNFTWTDYLLETNSEAAPAFLFHRGNLGHGFAPGMKLEAVDLMEPRLLCVATVTRVVERLLRIHFDGWDQEYDQWLDARSPDIYPVGWCELVGYDLQPPVNYKSQSSGDPEKNKRKAKSKTQGFTGKRKKKKWSTAGKKDLNSSQEDGDDISVDVERDNSTTLDEPKSEATDEMTDKSSFVDIDEDYQEENLAPSDIVQDFAPQKLGPPSDCGEFPLLEDIEQDDSEQSPTQADVSEENSPEKLPAIEGSDDLQPSMEVENSSSKVQNTHLSQQSDSPAVADVDSISTDAGTSRTLLKLINK